MSLCNSTLWDAVCPSLMKSAVGDDRTIRARRELLLRAILFIQKYDKKAGHLTNTIKLLLMATTAESSDWCEN